MIDGSKGAAFFDLDGTLIDFNSGMRFARFEHKSGRISSGKLIRSVLWMTLYKFSLVDMTKAYARALDFYRGQAARVLDQRTRDWFATEIADVLLPEARASMARHRQAGQPLVLLSSTSSYMATVATETWGLDAWLANIFPTDAAGDLTGAYQAPLCYGPGKVVRARNWADQHGIDLAHSHFYTDSFSDVPMLQAVGHPVVVNPDPRLRRRARREGWPVHQWRLLRSASAA